MADALHMETDRVHACVVQLRAECERIHQQAQALAVSARSVEWYGPSRDIFQYELEKIAIALSRLADEGDILASRGQHEASEWQQMDSYFTQQFSQIIISNAKRG